MAGPAVGQLFGSGAVPGLPDTPELSGIEVGQRLTNLFFGIHDKRTIPGYRLCDGFATHQQQGSRLFGLNGDRGAALGKCDQLAGSGVGAVVYSYGAMAHQQHHRMICRQLECGRAACRQVGIP